MDWIDLKLENAPFGALGIKDNYILEFTAAMIDRIHTASDFNFCNGIDVDAETKFCAYVGKWKRSIYWTKQKVPSKGTFHICETTYIKLHI